MIKRKIIFIILFCFISIYQTHGYVKEEENQIENFIKNIDGYNDKLNFISKLTPSNTKEVNFLLLQKKQIYSENLKQILLESKNDYNTSKELYLKYFQVLQSIDDEASINPFYFLKLKNKIHENDIYLKASIYIFYQIKEKLKSDKTYYDNYNKTIKENFQQNNELINFLDGEIIKYLKGKGLNYLSKNDGLYLKNYIINNKVGPDSKMFRYYLKYQSFLKNLKSNQILLKQNFTQKLQEKKLSCEVNSASLFASYILQEPVLEEQIFSHIPKYEFPLKKLGNQYIWGDPYQEFVGDINGKQTKFINKMTGYGVYASPISYALMKVGIKNKITSFDKDIIIKSLLENKPIMFWYLSENSDGTVNTVPVYWKTLENKIISGYIGEHTGVIVGVSFYNNGEIDKVFFYEGRNKELQSFSFETLKYQTSFFNMMITKD